MPKLGDVVLGKNIKALVFGRSGCGKTFGAGTWPRPNFLDFDKGISTLKNPDFIKKYGLRADIMYEQFPEPSLNSRGVPTSAEAFDNACRYFDACMKANAIWTNPQTGQKMNVGRDMFDTWIVDTGTSMSMLALYKSIVLLGGVFKGVKSETLGEALTHGLIFPKIQDYGSERSLVEQFIAMLYDTNKHVLFLCHEKEITDKSGIQTGVVPLLTGKGVEAISLMFDEVWHLESKKQGPDRVHILQTRTDGIISAKSRAGYPDGMAWNFETIKKEHEKLLGLQQQKGQ